MKGDFIGFSFDGIHCSELGITHVSSSDRYDEALFPEVKDRTIEIPNNHGEYYYGSNFGTRTFEIEIAFDSITETQFRNIRRLFGTNKICELIFDERPYKVYYAKIESPIELSYICFDEKTKTPSKTTSKGVRWVNITNSEGKVIGREREDITPWVISDKTQRIYKGEGSISLICYFPFARQLYKVLDLYKNNELWNSIHYYTTNLYSTYSNVDEWAESSGLLTESRYNELNLDRLVTSVAPYTYTIPVYNPGDLTTGFCLYIPFDENGKICAADDKNVIIINGDSNTLCLNKEIERKSVNDTGILINTNNHLIEGVYLSQVATMHDSRTPSWYTNGTLYNEYIVAGDFPCINRTDWILDSDSQLKQSINISCAEANGGIGIYYNYLYF